MKIYAYGIIDSKHNVNETITGLENAPVFSIPYRDMAVAVSMVDKEIRQITDTSVLEHERVVEELMADFTVLPIRFLTAFSAKEALLSMLEYYYEDFRDNLERLRNKVEFGIKVMWPAETIRQRIVEAYSRNKCAASIRADSPARTFLKERLEKHMANKEFQAEADKYIRTVDDLFSRIACEKKLRKLQTDNLLLNAAYLVAKEKEDEFNQAFGRLKNSPADLKFLFSGPWPPYNFVALTRKPVSADCLDTKDILSGIMR